MLNVFRSHFKVIFHDIFFILPASYICMRIRAHQCTTHDFGVVQLVLADTFLSRSDNRLIKVMSAFDAREGVLEPASGAAEILIRTITCR